jgi:hypothetical protein
MSTILPTKELLQMIEERIPYGRFLTTAALLLALLAIIVASCGYLYHAFILPTIGLAVTLVTTGKVNLSALGRTAIGFLASGAFYYVFEWTNRGVLRVMRDVLSSSKEIIEHNNEILSLAKDTNEQAITLANEIKNLEARVEALEETRS